MTIASIWIISAIANYAILHQPGLKYPSFWADFALHNPIVHINEFLLGMLAGYFAQQPSIRRLWSHPALPAIALSAAFILRPIITFDWARGLQISAGLLAPIFVWLIFAIATSPRNRLRFFGSRPAVLLGEASYALYVLHYPIKLAFSEYISPHLRVPKLAEFGIYALVLIFISITVHLSFETPIRHLIRRALAAPRNNRNQSTDGNLA
jgi:peptidoglycan/LPS O-acetylase OafA/YrhL